MYLYDNSTPKAMNWVLTILFKSILILSLALKVSSALMGPRIAFSSVSNRFGSKKYGTLRTPLDQIRKTVKIYEKFPSTKVVTDIDDTVKSSGGVKLFGIPLGGIDVSQYISFIYLLFYRLYIVLCSFILLIKVNPYKMSILSIHIYSRLNFIEETSIQEHFSLLLNYHQD